MEDSKAYMEMLDFRHHKGELTEKALQAIADKHLHITEHYWGPGDYYHRCGCGQQVWVMGPFTDGCDALRLCEYIAEQKGWTINTQQIDVTAEAKKRREAALRE